MYSYRPAISMDYPIICTFPQNAEELFYMYPRGTFPLTVEQIKETSESRLYPTVLLHNDKVIGYANIYDSDEQKRYWLGNVIVSKEYRGKGAAESLIQTMKSLAKNELNATTLYLVCHNNNLRGLLFYSKLEFKPFDIVKLKGLTGQPLAGIDMKAEL
jgi:RimJ/RimL family protein N-acetyltransferase